jgi:hypothetical protein
MLAAGHRSGMFYKVTSGGAKQNFLSSIAQPLRQNESAALIC